MQVFAAPLGDLVKSDEEATGEDQWISLEMKAHWQPGLNTRPGSADVILHWHHDAVLRRMDQRYCAVLPVSDALTVRLNCHTMYML